MYLSLYDLYMIIYMIYYDYFILYDAIFSNVHIFMYMIRISYCHILYFFLEMSKFEDSSLNLKKRDVYDKITKS